MTFFNLANEQLQAAKELASQLHIDGYGLNIYFNNSDKSLIVKKDGSTVNISYSHTVEIFRGLGLLKENIDKDSFEVTNTARFSSCGIMVDASRGSVPTVKTVKKIIRYMAVMGLNFLMLYTEDTYTADGFPYFGYMRGRYSHDELKECDDYAYIHGIEMVPCIQTLGHMEKTFRWPHLSDAQNNAGCFMVGEDATYSVISKLLDAASAPFRSRRIHIGMDEAYGVSLDKYWAKNGLRPTFDVLTEHLGRVYRIAEEKGLKPMIWSDMFFCEASKKHFYHDIESELPESVAAAIPKELQLVYWNYYNNDYETYSSLLKKHLAVNKNSMFSGGIWTWGSSSTSYSKSFKTNKPALKACLDLGIKEVFATMWGDDGAETNIFTAMLGWQLYAETCYNPGFSDSELASRFKACTGADMDAFLLFDQNDFADEHCIIDTEPPTVAKEILFQDVFMGLFDVNVTDIDSKGFYRDKLNKVCTLPPQHGFEMHFEQLKVTYSILYKKADIGVELKKAYDNGDTEKLAQLAKILCEIQDEVSNLHLLHRRNWYNTYKAFGWNLHDIRYGGVIARLQTAIDILDAYLNKEIDQIDELRETKLMYGGDSVKPGKTLLPCCSVNAIEIV